MCPDDSTSGLELELGFTLLHRNALARSLLLRTRRRARTPDAAHSLRTLSHLGAGLTRRPTDDDATALPRFLSEAARRVREHAARQSQQAGPSSQPSAGLGLGPCPLQEVKRETTGPGPLAGSQRFTSDL